VRPGDPDLPQREALARGGQGLVAGGLSSVYHVDEGFEGELDEHHHRGTKGGWRFRGLPWEQC
jgi:hypothetical protein